MNVKQLNVESDQSSLTWVCIVCFNQTVAKIRKILRNHISSTLRKRLRISSVISVNYHYITVLCPFNLLICFKCYNTV